MKAKVAAVSRVDGADRFAVSAKIGQTFFPSPITTETVYIATGLNYPDALAGGVLAAQGGSPLFLAKEFCIPQDMVDQIVALKAKKVVLLGGESSLNSNVANFDRCL